MLYDLQRRSVLSDGFLSYYCGIDHITIVVVFSTSSERSKEHLHAFQNIFKVQKTNQVVFKMTHYPLTPLGTVLGLSLPVCFALRGSLVNGVLRI